MSVIQRTPDQCSEDQKILKGLRRRINEVEKQAKELDGKTALPRVEADGSSECPFAENLYAQKEEAEEKLIQSVHLLEECLPMLDREISRCRSNWDRIRVDSQQLHGPEARNGYTASEQEQMHQYNTLVEDRKQIPHVLKKAGLVLEMAQGIKFPGGKPQRRGPVGAAPIAAGPSPVQAHRPMPHYAPPLRPIGGLPPSAPIVNNPGLPSGGELGGILSTGPLK